MTLFSRAALITLSAILLFGPAHAKPDCQKLIVPKRVDAAIAMELGCAEQLTGTIREFANYQGNTMGICYKSNGRIPAKLDGKNVEMETVSAFLNNGTLTSQLVISLFNLYSRGDFIGAIYAIDNIHLQEGYEDEIFIGGTEQFQNAGGTGKLSYTASQDGMTIGFTRLKGEVCLSNGE